MNIFSTVKTNCVKSWKHIPYTWAHNRCMQSETKRILGYCPYPLHDVDKLLMYIFLPFLGTTVIQQIHKKYASHHLVEGKKHMNFQEAVFDWHIAHFTKKDKQDSAWVTKEKRYKMFDAELNPIFDKLNLRE